MIGDLQPAAVRAIPALVNAMKTDSAPLVRGQAAEALGKMGPAAKGAIPSLIRIIGAREQVNYRHVFVKALGLVANRTDARAVATLKTAATDLEPVTMTEARAALKLWGYEPPTQSVESSADRLFAQLNDADQHVRQIALMTLKDQATVDARYVDGLARALDDSDGLNFWYAANALAKTAADGRPAVPALLLALEKKRDASGQRYLSEALMRIAPNDPIVLRALRRQLIESSSWVDIDAYAGALVMAGATGVPYLIEALRSDNPFAIFGAAGALRLLGPSARAALPELLRVARTPTLLSVRLTDGGGSSSERVGAALSAIAGSDTEAQKAVRALKASRHP